ncbi:hypothetical protein LOY38_06440 [Pseudomonas sp. B21-015]|uniref:hypothetical protein n=1 Tax=Pseudomonas sp. B21-015 TaxID=2895473 RepID=UPI0021601EE7|nr:hypothetical protein [Pseudomonas sp. B21-015]UVM51677.1 hypothetical protein LOY38_06440 [Pseudomonas sp. B21-015]
MTNLSENSNAATQVLVFSTDADPLRVLADVPPFIPGYKSLANNVVGVNRNMVNSDRRGLLGYIFPYFNMDSTDEIRLYLGSRPTPVGELFFVGQYVNQLVPFYIPTDLLEQMYASPAPMPDALSLYFSVKRPSENEKNSPSLPLLYKPFGPGEADTRLDLPNNQGLALPIPSETVIDKTVIENGMFVTVPRYEYQAIDDVVYLAVGPRELRMVVTALGDLLFELTPDFLATLPNTDRVALAYEIWDIVENGSGWSSAVFLALKPTEQLLIAPVIDQAEPGNPDNLKHHALNGETATVLLNEQFTAGDVVVLTIVLSTAVGDRVERVIPLNVRSNTRSLRIDLENEFIQNGIRGGMTLGYTRQRARDTRHSRSYTVTISGLVLPAPAPTIDEQKGEELPADTTLAHVRIPTYRPLVNGATVELYWQVTGTDGVAHLYIFRQVIIDATQPVIFTVKSDYIDRYGSSPLTVLYKIENPGKAVVQSEPLQITIGETVGWTDLHDTFQSNYGGWIPWNAARGGSIRNWAGVTAFFNFTDSGPVDQAAGAIFYRDVEFPPGQYVCSIEACHIKEYPNPGLRNPLLSVEDSAGSAFLVHELPKNGVWYTLSIRLTITQKQTRRLYLNNRQNISNGNDFGIRNVRITRIENGGAMSNVPTASQAPQYNGVISKLVLPDAITM